MHEHPMPSSGSSEGLQRCRFWDITGVAFAGRQAMIRSCTCFRSSDWRYGYLVPCTVLALYMDSWFSLPKHLIHDVQGYDRISETRQPKTVPVRFPSPAQHGHLLGRPI
jgi:hypothetical protein